MSDKTVAIYEEMLIDLECEIAKNAVKRILDSSTFLPSIAEIRKAATDLKLGAVRAGGEAWGDVVNAIRFVGAYGVPKFSDPIVAECVECLNWRALCLGENEISDRSQFVKLYDTLAARARADDVAGSDALRLPKWHEVHRLPRNAPGEQPGALAGLLGSTIKGPQS